MSTLGKQDANQLPSLPSPFQSSSSTTSAITKFSSSKGQANYLCGYQSNFSVKQQTEHYQQYKRQQQEQNPNFNNGGTPTKHVHNQFQQQTNVDNGGWCELCERGFKNQRQLEKHYSEHERCCFEGCNFEGHRNSLKKHIEMQHNSGLFQRIGQVETEEDIEKWREERKRRYPTKANIEARQMAQAERLKRGERLEDPNKRFGKASDRRRANDRSQQQRHNKQDNDNEASAMPNRGKNKRQRNKRNKGNNRKEIKNVESSEMVEKKNEPVERFTGISQLKEPQPNPVAPPQASLSETKSQGNALTALLGFYGDTVSDSEEESITESSQAKDTVPIENNNEPANSSADISEEIKSLEKCTESELEPVEVIERVDNLTIEKSSDDEAPEEQSIQRFEDVVKEQTVASTDLTAADATVTRKRPASPPAKTKVPKKKTMFDSTRKIRNQNSLLEKLLQKDIRHERNVLLQCVRYVVENNFFGVGQSPDQQK